ncbi:hypothetical protein FRC11_002855 [Ceratobasidium sp. 423]|nr:hypothetical protein FRC11_002855 [Ceratobasidium sp. 423]
MSRELTADDPAMEFSNETHTDNSSSFEPVKLSDVYSGKVLQAFTGHESDIIPAHYLCKLFRDLFVRKGYQYDYVFDWSVHHDSPDVDSRCPSSLN